jgi:restriction endonuclease Mrr
MMKGLFEAECAGQNPLVKLTSQFTGSANEQKLTMDALKGLKHFDSIAQHQNQQQQLQQQQLLHQQQQQMQHSAELNADELVHEYLRIDPNASRSLPAIGTKRMPAPRSFHMEALLNELKHIDNTTATIGASHDHQQQIQGENQLAKSSSGDWAQEYWSSLSAAFQKQSPFITTSSMDEKAFKWSTDYLTQNEATIFDEAWENLLMRNALSPTSTSSNLLTTSTLTDSGALANSNTQLNDEMLKTANELLDSMQDSRFSESEVCQ